MKAEKKGLRTILIVGSGVTGRGIGAMFAAGGFAVTIHNPRRGRSDDIPSGCGYSQGLPSGTPDLIVECVPEVLDTKIAVFAGLEAAYGNIPILASNTSGLPLESIAATLAAPERFLGMHFFTPADVSPLVEVIPVARTKPAVVEAAVDALARCGKRSLRVSQPVIGHLVNRLQHAILHEAYHLIGNGIATAADIDAIAKELLGPRFCVTGLVESKDRGGLEVNARSQQAIVPHLCKSAKPHAFLERMVAEGRQGVRSGRGFYEWEGCDRAAVARTAAERLSRLNAFLAEEIWTAPPVPAPLPLADDE